MGCLYEVLEVFGDQGGMVNKVPNSSMSLISVNVHFPQDKGYKIFCLGQNLVIFVLKKSQHCN